jgi:hypothetical protein
MLKVGIKSEKAKSEERNANYFRLRVGFIRYTTSPPPRTCAAETTGMSTELTHLPSNTR